MMLPSFFDAHAHPDFGSLLDLRALQYSGSAATVEEYIGHIRRYLGQNPDTLCLRGTG
jgi:predicted amidohydrolase YtcJ